MNNKEIMDMVKSHEGYRDRVYFDSIGIPTGGYGHAFLPGSPLPPIVCDILFEHDFNSAVKDYEIIVNRYQLDLDPVRRAVIIDMLFNMGLSRLQGFKKMLAALSIGDWDRAADEMLDSKWAMQVGNRSTYLAEMMRKGV